MTRGPALSPGSSRTRATRYRGEDPGQRRPSTQRGWTHGPGRQPYGIRLSYRALWHRTAGLEETPSVVVEKDPEGISAERCAKGKHQQVDEGETEHQDAARRRPPAQQH